MSEHHRTPGWQKFTGRVRPIIAATLPAPCVQPRCRYDGIVHEGQSFDVAHIISPDLGGEDTVDNVGPAHPKCNRSDGGRVGAAITNAKRKTEKRELKW